METEDNIGRTEVGLGTKNYRGGNFRGNTRDFDRQDSRGEYRIMIGMKVMIEAGTGLGKGYYSEAIIVIEIGVQTIAGPGQDQE